MCELLCGRTPLKCNYYIFFKHIILYHACVTITSEFATQAEKKNQTGTLRAEMCSNTCVVQKPSSRGQQSTRAVEQYQKRETEGERERERGRETDNLFLLFVLHCLSKK